MSDRLDDALEVCLEALHTGVSIESCLAMYPDLARGLRPALEAAVLLPRPESAAPPHAALRRGRTRLLSRAAQLRPQRRSSPPLRGLPRLALALCIVAVALGLGWGGLAAASAQALPGDLLYGFKRTSENLSLSLAPRQESRLALESDYTRRRSDEVRDLLTLGRVQSVSFEGIVGRLGERWLVDGIAVDLSAQTRTVGDVSIGDTVEVEGDTSADGTVAAHEIHVRAYQIIGPVQAIGFEAWKVNGMRVAVDPSTAVAPGIQPGDMVLVLLDVNSDDVATARAILLVPPPTATEPSPSVPAPTPVPTATTEPQPTQEAQPSEGEPMVAEFTGRVESMGTSSWTVGGTNFRVTPETEIEPGIGLAAPVLIHARQAPDGTWTAVKIEFARSGDGGGFESPPVTPMGTKSGGEGGERPEATSSSGEQPDKVSFTGTLQSSGGPVWMIGEKQVHVDSRTEIRGSPHVGDTVKVEASRQADGSLLAGKIEKQD